MLFSPGWTPFWLVELLLKASIGIVFYLTEPGEVVARVDSVQESQQLPHHVVRGLLERRCETKVDFFFQCA